MRLPEQGPKIVFVHVHAGEEVVALALVLGRHAHLLADDLPNKEGVGMKPTASAPAAEQSHSEQQ